MIFEVGSTPAARTTALLSKTKVYVDFPTDSRHFAGGMKKPQKPIAVKVGNVTVKIYRSNRTKAGKSYTQFDVSDYTSGRRKFISFADEAEARRKANEIAIKLANSEGDVLRLSSTDRAAYLRSLEILKPTGKPLELAAAEYAEARQKLGPHALGEAVNFFLKHNPASLPKRTVSEVCNELLIAKTADGASAVYLKDLSYRLGKFAAAFHCEIAGITTGQINEFLRALKSVGRGRNNYRMAIGTLFNFAQATGYIPKGLLDFSEVARAKEDCSNIDIFTPKQMAALLVAAQLDPENLKPGFNKRYATGPGLLPLLVLGGFCGLRTAEIERQVWEDIHLERGFLRVSAVKGNTAQKRHVPLTENAKQWLSLIRKESGPVCEIARTPDAIRRLAERAGVPWKHNALRHSFASYRLADVKSAPQVSLEMGNTPNMVFRHYRELVTESEAKAWFTITPSKDKNVVPLPAAG